MTLDTHPRYMISIAAELVGMHPQTLRMYEGRGLVKPKRTPGNTRLYSDADIERLRVVQQLTSELGLNLAAVRHVLELEDELGRLRRRVERLEERAREQVRAVHKQYRRELVLYEEAKLPATTRRKKARSQ